MTMLKLASNVLGKGRSGGSDLVLRYPNPLSDSSIEYKDICPHEYGICPIRANIRTSSTVSSFLSYAQMADIQICV